MSETMTGNDLAEGLSDAAIVLCLGWFSFGSKATVNIDPPHANLLANKEAIEELIAAGHITHSYDARNDRHSYKGSMAATLIRTSDRAKAIVAKLLGDMS